MACVSQQFLVGISKLLFRNHRASRVNSANCCFADEINRGNIQQSHSQISSLASLSDSYSDFVELDLGRTNLLVADVYEDISLPF